MQITIVHGIFLLLPTQDLWGLPSNLLFYLPSIVSSSSPPPFTAEQPLLPGERRREPRKETLSMGSDNAVAEQSLACTGGRWCWATPPTLVNCRTRQSLLLFIGSLHWLSRFSYPDTYLIFVIFFTQAKFLENKIYTEICTYLIIVADAADAVSVNFSGRCKFFTNLTRKIGNLLCILP